MYKFAVGDKVRVIGYPMETAAQGVPLGTIGEIIDRGFDSRFGCEEYHIEFPQVTCWITPNHSDIVLERVSPEAL